MDINSPSSAAVTFEESTGTLELDQSASFPGQISRFGDQDQIDLRDISFGQKTTLGWTENASNSGGILTVSEGAHTASLALLGQYMASSFATASDSHSGTLITDPPSVNSQLLVPPHP